MTRNGNDNGVGDDDSNYRGGDSGDFDGDDGGDSGDYDGDDDDDHSDNKNNNIDGNDKVVGTVPCGSSHWHCHSLLKPPVA